MLLHQTIKMDSLPNYWLGNQCEVCDCHKCMCCCGETLDPLFVNNYANCLLNCELHETNLC